MTVPTPFVRISKLTQNPCYSVKSSIERAKSELLWRGCHIIKPTVGAIEGYYSHTPRVLPLNFETATHCAVVYKSFLRLLPRDIVEQCFHVGPVYSTGKEFQRNWSTLNGKYPVNLRGESHVVCRRCEVCARIVYYALEHNYLCPAPVQGVDMLDAGCGKLVLSRRLFDSLDLRAWKSLHVVDLPILETPRDGFPIDLEEYCPLKSDGSEIQ
jgi:hypothetical protein